MITILGTKVFLNRILSIGLGGFSIPFSFELRSGGRSRSKTFKFWQQALNVHLSKETKYGYQAEAIEKLCTKNYEGLLLNTKYIIMA